MDLSRNIGILTEEQQAQIGNTRVAVLGLGMGSNIAELLARSGFSNLVLIDGDVVSESNLNRQIYVHEDISKNKAECTRDKLLTINPQIKLHTVPEYLSKNLIELPSVDLVIDTIDLSSVEIILALHRRMRDQGVPVIFPFNIGWKSVVTVFTSRSQTIEEMLGLDNLTIKKVASKDFSFWAEFLSKYVPEYGVRQYQDFIKKASSIDDWCPAPQLGITVSTTASIVVALAIKTIIGQNNIQAPEVKTVDLFM